MLQRTATPPLNLVVRLKERHQMHKQVPAKNVMVMLLPLLLAILQATAGDTNIILSIESAASGTSTLAWRSVPGQFHRVEMSTNLNPCMWEPISDDFLISPTSNAIFVAVQSSHTAFYRVLRQPADALLVNTNPISSLGPYIAATVPSQSGDRLFIAITLVDSDRNGIIDHITKEDTWSSPEGSFFTLSSQAHNTHTGRFVDVTTLAPGNSNAVATFQTALNEPFDPLVTYSNVSSVAALARSILPSLVVTNQTVTIDFPKASVSNVSEIAFSGPWTILDPDPLIQPDFRDHKIFAFPVTVVPGKESFTVSWLDVRSTCPFVESYRFDWVREGHEWPANHLPEFYTEQIDGPFSFTVGNGDAPPGNYTLWGEAKGGNETDVCLFWSDKISFTVKPVDAPEIPVISVSPPAIGRSVDSNVSSAGIQMRVSNSGDGTLRYRCESDSTWIAVNPPRGEIESGENIHWVNLTGLYSLGPGTYQGRISICDEHATPTTMTIDVTLTIEGTPHTYQFISGGFTWHAAKADAEARGGHLATIASAEENALVAATITGPNVDHAWLGGTDEGHEDSWSWVTGETWGYDSWGSGQPDNQGGNQDYLVCFPSGVWDDKQNNNSNPDGYVLEIEQ